MPPLTRRYGILLTADALLWYLADVLGVLAFMAAGFGLFGALGAYDSSSQNDLPTGEIAVLLASGVGIAFVAVFAAVLVLDLIVTVMSVLRLVTRTWVPRRPAIPVIILLVKVLTVLLPALLGIIEWALLASAPGPEGTGQWGGIVVLALFIVVCAAPFIRFIQLVTGIVAWALGERHRRDLALAQQVP